MADNYWAYGASFHPQKVKDGAMTGKNLLGLIWVKVRRDIRKALNQPDNENADMLLEEN